jgi:predicted transport protein
MPKSPNEMIEAIVVNLPAKTGKTAEQWVEILRKDGPEGYKAQVDWLKKEHRLGHMQASLIAQFQEQGGNAYVDGEKLIDDLFSGKHASLRSLYESLAKEITSMRSDVKVQPAVTMVVFYRHKKFTHVQPVNGAIEIVMAIPHNTAKKTDKPGDADRINMKPTIATVSDVESLHEGLKMAYILNKFWFFSECWVKDLWLF